MILSRLIVQWLEVIIEVGLWIFLIASFIAGWMSVDGFFAGLIRGIISMIIGAIFSAVLFGFFILLADIRKMLKQLLDMKTVA